MPIYDFSRSDGSAPPPSTSYTSVATWVAAGHSGSSTAIFAYPQGGSSNPAALHYSCDAQTSGEAPRTRPAAGVYRIRVTGPGTNASMNTGLIGEIPAGTIDNGGGFQANHGATNQCTIRTGTAAQFSSTFSGVPSSGVIWHFDRQTSSGGGGETILAGWHYRLPLGTDTIYRLVRNATTRVWSYVRKDALVNGNLVLARDSDNSNNWGYRTVADNLSAQNGTPLQSENGNPLSL